MSRMPQSLPTTPDEWLDEIGRAIADARKTKPFGLLTGQRITDDNLFHLAPLVCMKFRGLDFRDEKLRTKVTEGALANYVANSDPEGVLTDKLVSSAHCIHPNVGFALSSFHCR